MKYIVCFIGVLMAHFSFAQKDTLRIRLESELENATTDSLKVEAYLKHKHLSISERLCH